MELTNPLSYQEARVFYQMLTDRKTGGQTSISLRLEGITKKIFIKRNDNKERVRPGVVELGWGGGAGGGRLLYHWIFWHLFF